MFSVVVSALWFKWQDSLLTVNRSTMHQISIQRSCHRGVGEWIAPLNFMENDMNACPKTAEYCSWCLDRTHSQSLCLNPVWYTSTAYTCTQSKPFTRSRGTRIYQEDKLQIMEGHSTLRRALYDLYICLRIRRLFIARWNFYQQTSSNPEIITVLIWIIRLIRLQTQVVLPIISGLDVYFLVFLVSR